jgi:hypothetical protein
VELKDLGQELCEGGVSIICTSLFTKAGHTAFVVEDLFKNI